MPLTHAVGFSTASARPLLATGNNRYASTANPRCVPVLRFVRIIAIFPFASARVSTNVPQRCRKIQATAGYSEKTTRSGRDWILRRRRTS